MKTKAGIICAVAILVAILIGCSPSPQKSSLEFSCDDFMSQHHITREVSVKTGDTFTVTLCSNPSTGFLWGETAQISDPAVLQQLSHEFISPEETEAMGVPGKDVWTFKALKKGSGTISLEYSRPWEGGEKGEWTFRLDVTIN